MSELPFGIDVSRYQGCIDWDVIAAHQTMVLFAGIRATISWGYTDPWFMRNLEECRRVGIIPLPYHVVYPAEDAERQMEHFLMVAMDALMPRLVLDCELDHGRTAQQITENLEDCLDHLELNVGVKPIIYSRAGWINQFTLPGGWRNQYDWWLAQYLVKPMEHPGPVLLPAGVSRERCIIHQTWDKGTPFGVESKALDYNRWQGDEASLRKYFGLDVVPVVKTLEERVTELERWRDTEVKWYNP